MDQASNDPLAKVTLPLRRARSTGDVGDDSLSVVYIVQDNPQHAFWPAEKYGKTRHCLPARGDYNVDAMTIRLREAFRDFDAQTDYVLLSGAPIACAIAFAILHERFDQFQVLRWSVPAQDYNAVTVNLMASEAPTKVENL